MAFGCIVVSTDGAEFKYIAFFRFNHCLVRLALTD